MDLPPVLLQKLTDLFRKQPGLEKVYLFGSRAKGGASEVSDVDLAIVARGWDDKRVNLLKNELEETIPTPLKFDLVLISKMKKENFKRNVLKEGTLVYDT